MAELAVATSALDKAEALAQKADAQSDPEDKQGELFEEHTRRSKIVTWQCSALAALVQVRWSVDR